MYRALEHGFVKKVCLAPTISKFPKDIQDFANQFVLLQDKRHKSDYDPYEKIFKSAVLADIAIVETVIAAFEKTPLRHRRAFVAYVLLRQPRT